MDILGVEDVLDFAIAKEQEAHDLYARVAEMVRRPGLRQTFLELAEMELGHRRRLEGIKAGGTAGFGSGPVSDLGLTDLLVDVKPSPEMTYQEALLFAMKAEQRAHDLYIGLAKAVSGEELRETFRALAREELKHKLFFETEYDDVILEGN